jgi:hypothetical protein
VCAIIIVTVVIGFWAPCLQSLYMLIGDNLLLTRIKPYGIIYVNLLSVLQLLTMAIMLRNYGPYGEIFMFTI